MNSSQKLLTIAIPTYNRVQYLKECLEHVVPQAENDEDVEIIVSDNASTDETKSMMEGFCKQHPLIRYIRNETNVGADGNFLKCLRAAKGEFVHILSDDDILLDGGIQSIKKCIKDNRQSALLFLNLSSFHGDFDPNKCVWSRFRLKENLVFDDGNKFIRHIGIYLTFISGLVFNKTYFNKIEEPEKYLNTYLFQSHIVLNCIAPKTCAVIVAHRCVAGRNGNSGGYDLYKVFAYEWKKVLFETGLKNGFSKKNLCKLYKDTIKHFLPRNTKLFRLNSSNLDLSNKKLLFNSTWDYWGSWFYLYPYVFLPKGFLVFRKKISNYLKTKRVFLKNIFKKTELS